MNRLMKVCCLLLTLVMVTVACGAFAEADYGPAKKLRMGTSGAPEDISTKAAKWF